MECVDDVALKIEFSRWRSQRLRSIHNTPLGACNAQQVTHLRDETGRCASKTVDVAVPIDKQAFSERTCRRLLFRCCYMVVMPLPAGL